MTPGDLYTYQYRLLEVKKSYQKEYREYIYRFPVYTRCLLLPLLAGELLNIYETETPSHEERKVQMGCTDTPEAF